MQERLHTYLSLQGKEGVFITVIILFICLFTYLLI